MRLCDIWKEQCDAARQIEDEFGTQKALSYLIGEKFLNFLEAAETDAEFRAEIPALLAEIKTIFETWQLTEYLEVARQSEPFDASLYEPMDEEEAAEIDPEDAEDVRQNELRRSASDLLLVERAREWLLREADHGFSGVNDAAFLRSLLLYHSGHYDPGAPEPHLGRADLIERPGSVLRRGLRGHTVDEPWLVRRRPIRAVR
jgi:hypothetical protein